MRSQRILVGLLGAALLGATPVALSATTADAGEPATLPSEVRDATYNFNAAHNVPWYGDKITFAGVIAVACDSADTALTCIPAVADDKVDVYRRVLGSSTEKLVATTTVDDVTGEFSVRTPSAGSADYTLVYSGTGYDASAAGGILKGSRALGGNVKSGYTLYYKGNVNPGWGRKNVTIQKKACKSCAWKAYKTVRASRTGAYSAKIGAPRRGAWRFRSTIPGTKPRYVRAYGNVWKTTSGRQVVAHRSVRSHARPLR